MKNLRYVTLVVLLVSVLGLSACSAAIPSAFSLVDNFVVNRRTAAPVAAAVVAAAPAPQLPAARPAAKALVAGDLQERLEEIYSSVNPAVVNIRVAVKPSAAMGNLPQIPGMPNFFSLPDGEDEEGDLPNAPMAMGEGSGFVWDTQGHLVTNNHVVDSAEKVLVTFADGTTVPATVVGVDPESDLAVIKVDSKAVKLQPITVGDSNNVEGRPVCGRHRQSVRSRRLDELRHRECPGPQLAGKRRERAVEPSAELHDPRHHPDGCACQSRQLRRRAAGSGWQSRGRADGDRIAGARFDGRRFRSPGGHREAGCARADQERQVRPSVDRHQRRHAGARRGERNGPARDAARRAGRRGDCWRPCGEGGSGRQHQAGDDRRPGDQGRRRCDHGDRRPAGEAVRGSRHLPRSQRQGGPDRQADDPA